MYTFIRIFDIHLPLPNIHNLLFELEISTLKYCTKLSKIFQPELLILYIYIYYNSVIYCLFGSSQCVVQFSSPCIPLIILGRRITALFTFVQLALVNIRIVLFDINYYYRYTAMMFTAHTLIICF